MFSRSNIAKHFYGVLIKFESSSAKLINYKNIRFITLSPQKYQNVITNVDVKKIEFTEKSPVNTFSLRTHTCGELSDKNIGDYVELSGWMEFQRMGKFFTLRDSYGSTQVVIPDERNDLKQLIENLPYESILRINGEVVSRPENQQNKKMSTGEIEILANSIIVLNKAAPQLPFAIRSHNMAKESLQMKYRYLSLRFPEMQRNLRMRSKLLARMRDFLINKCSFVDVETPTLFRRTPGGAQEYVVPTREPGKFYSLVQSPQQFKQLLMVGGIDRYFQIARCYRDEGARHDRQPEFTQLDIEMSFVNQEGIMELTEQLLINAWPEDLEPIKVPFRRLKYDDVMEKYGTDQPDLRIPYEIQYVMNLDETKRNDTNNDYYSNNCNELYALKIPINYEHFNKSVREKLGTIKRDYFPTTKLIQLKVHENSWKEQINRIFVTKANDILERLNVSEGDILFLASGPKDAVRKLLGKIRVEFVNMVESNGYKIRSSGYEFAWIIDFPLFSCDYNDNKCILESTHHPFTQPHENDIQYLFTDPVKVRGLHYDLVMNGYEIGGGSVRIHEAKLQEQILDMLRIDKSHLLHMLEALNSGAPPHAGIALGLDRFIAALCKSNSIRNVIAFPKTMEGRDLMSGAPAIISDEEKLLYHLKVSKE